MSENSNSNNENNLVSQRRGPPLTGSKEEGWKKHLFPDGVVGGSIDSGEAQQNHVGARVAKTSKWV